MDNITLEMARKYCELSWEITEFRTYVTANEQVLRLPNISERRKGICIRLLTDNITTINRKQKEAQPLGILLKGVCHAEY